MPSVRRERAPFYPSLLVGKHHQVYSGMREPALLWNQLRSLTWRERVGPGLTTLASRDAASEPQPTADLTCKIEVAKAGESDWSYRGRSA